MVYLVRGTALLLFAVVVACVATDCNQPDTETEFVYAPRPKAPQQNIKICEPARASVPINFQAADYNGPYDPLDPKGIGAAHRRELKMKGKDLMGEIKSFYPQGLDHFIKKEAIKLGISEGKRFAFAHPKETAILIDLARRAKKLASTAMDKVDKESDCKDDKHKHDDDKKDC